jgi:hypothetical protein
VIAIVLLIVLIPTLVFGIVYVPGQDGRVSDWALGVFLPTAGISWCLWQLVRGSKERPRPISSTPMP